MELLKKSVDIKNRKMWNTKSGIYCIEDLQGRIYIGSAKSFYQRYATHFSALNTNKHRNQKLQNYYNKYGKDSLKFYICEECDKNVLIIKEQKYLDNFFPYFNINKTANRLDNYNGVINEKNVFEIAQMYNNKINTGIIGKIFKINSCVIGNLASGRTYPEYSYLFNYRPFGKGNIQSKETIEKRIRNRPYKRRSNLSENQIIGILTDYKDYSLGDISLKYNIKESIIKSLIFKKEVAKDIKEKINFKLTEERKQIKGLNNKQQIFSKELILEIADLYNNNLLPIDIARKLFNDESKRFAIAKLAKGVSYKEYSYLFENKNYHGYKLNVK